MQPPPEYPENDPSLEHEDDLVNKVYGPSQSDIDRSRDGYESEQASRGLGSLIRKLMITVVSLVILGSLSIGLLGPLFGGSRSSQPAPPERVSADVLRVIDGRTIVVDWGDGEQTVRLIGVELPPFGDPFHDFTQEVTQSWIEGKEVLLEADQQDGDEQGRLMRYVFFDTVMINAALLLNGLGTLTTDHPNILYSDYLLEMERQARESGVGIWDSSSGEKDELQNDDSQAMNSFRTTAGATAS
ncbi:MAG TPA: thermonuclease family protein [Dehalococcoidia bacterium]|jgi:micrococcal nuclease|nr:hypothetical protein [Chloroflexota bacterium]MDP6056119.1 thermonuclease family protein [Dehalococcoidia bacterium]MDP7090851.1 thermonuclease family protein [Dehalococcoidia bacterium]MDP7262539.1 thermonuclease family protein [Dehalococcoidia bacterium]MDP7486122.1 thermonuclease family protein [Dehalococcoidia bacterium]|tara:strand:- start:12324 stop:13052 length:729 start_codon:yes stop_codon:yes gene_type:complete